MKNFNSLYTVLKRLVHFDCDGNISTYILFLFQVAIISVTRAQIEPIYNKQNFVCLFLSECETSAASDVAIFLDSSHFVTANQYSLSLDAIIHLIDVMKLLSVNNTRVSVTSFSDDITNVIRMGETYDKNIIKSRLNMIAQSTSKNRVDLETVYTYVRGNIFNETFSRQNAKKFFLVFTNGNVEINDVGVLEREKSMLEDEGIKIFAIGSGGDSNMKGLIQLVTDTFNVFITGKNSPLRNLDVLQSEFVYNKCDLKGE